MGGILKFFEEKYKVLFVLLIAIISAICLINLGEFAVQDWDEARHGVNAYEMFKNKEYIVTTYNYSNDYWNLKPPISPLLITFFFSIFGPSIFSFRLYSAIAIIILAIVVAIFMKKRYGKAESIVSLILFATCKPIFLSHLGRYGDADAVFLLFTTISLLSMFYIEKNKKFLYISGFFFSLAFLTKSWHSLFIVAIGGLYLLFSGEIKKIKLLQWFKFILSFVVPIGIWVALRIKADGLKFITEMIRYDLLKRTSTGIEGNGQNILFYTKHMIAEISISALVFIVFLIMLKYFKKVINKENLPFILWILVPFIAFNIAKTKLVWYIVPIYIPIILFSAYLIVEFLRKDKSFLRYIVAAIVSVSILINGTILGKTILSPDSNSVQDFIKEASKYDNLKGRDAYIDNDSNEWRQSEVFVAEIYLDAKTVNGGVQAFEDANEGILIVSYNTYNSNESLKNYEKVYENEEFVALIGGRN